MKAIDIALLPPDEIMDICIDMSKSGTKDDGTSVQLNKIDFLPHLTLVMAAVDDNNLPEIEKTVKKTPPIPSRLKLNSMNLPSTMACGQKEHLSW